MKPGFGRNGLDLACVTADLGHLGKKVGLSHLIRDVKIVKIVKMWTSFSVKAGVNISPETRIEFAS